MSDSIFKPLLGDDPDFVARWRAAIAAAPVSEQPIQNEIMELCFSIELTAREGALDVRDRAIFHAQRNAWLEAHNHAR